MKTLKLWNGRPYCVYKSSDLPNRRMGNGHAYVAAYSRADAIRMIHEYRGHGEPLNSELRDYWSEGHWGTSMNGIEPHRGIWLSRSYHDKPVLVFDGRSTIERALR